MSKISDNELMDLKEYAVKTGQVSIPQIQQEFGWSYSKAKRGVEKLVERNKLKYQKGIVYKAVKSRDEESDIILSEIRIVEAEIERYREEYKKAEEERLASLVEEPFVLCEEEDSIKSYIKIMDDLSQSAFGEKPAQELSGREALPDKYVRLVGNVKKLVNIAVKFAKSKKSARFGLFQSSLKWRKKFQARLIYESAIAFVDSLTEKEFRIINRRLADK